MSSSSSTRLARAALAVALGAVLAFAVTVVVGMRTRNPAVLGAMHRMQRDTINPRALAAAGQPGSAHAILRHTGRTSGRSYQTPVGAVVSDDTVTIVLVYGSNVDWARNILAAGRASILVEGAELELTDPQVLPLAQTVLAGTMDLVARLLGITDALVMQIRRTDADPS